MLIAVARDQDRQAFILLFEHFAPRIKSFLMRSGTDHAAADELAQETMLTVWRKAGRFDPSRAGVSTWIFTIARNLRIDGQRRRRRADAFVPDASDDESDVPSSEEAVLISERDDRVRAAIDTMPAAQADLVRLSFYGEKSHAQIAAELNIPLGTVKSRMRRAMEHLRKMLDDAP